MQLRQLLLARAQHTTQRMRLAGWAFIIGGIGVLVGEHMRPPIAREDLALMLIAVTAVIVGTILVAAAFLAKPTSAENAAYNLGHDIGEAKGYREGRRCRRPTVVPISDEEDGDGDGDSSGERQGAPR